MRKPEMLRGVLRRSFGMVSWVFRKGTAFPEASKENSLWQEERDLTYVRHISSFDCGKYQPSPFALIIVLSPDSKSL